MPRKRKERMGLAPSIVKPARIYFSPDGGPKQVRSDRGREEEDVHRKCIRKEMHVTYRLGDSSSRYVCSCAGQLKTFD
ncbi:hypothetical protein KPH14_003664 [Odynerus spinipes]|uniref:Uncharacterized protein n=1 Tax=Odynerus spinipes TaxID=1348599 RepID=A0AAD9RYH3_9HYME|nr:hypothetical protein KPH14_003664 [Odynerus spinipes]